MHVSHKGVLSISAIHQNCCEIVKWLLPIINGFVGRSFTNNYTKLQLKFLFHKSQCSKIIRCKGNKMSEIRKQTGVTINIDYYLRGSNDRVCSFQVNLTLLSAH